MNKKSVLFNKTLIIGVIYLFIGIIILPNINGHIQKENDVVNEIIDAQTLGSYEITVETDKYYYFHGETVTFFGQITEDGVGFKARIQYDLRDPRNYNTFGGMMYTEGSGYFNITYKTHSNAINGVYHFKVYYHEDPSVFATTEIEVLPSLQIEKIKGGLGKISAQIKNIRGKDLINVTWLISVVPTRGNFLFEDILIEETIPLFKENETVQIKTDVLMIGIGTFEVCLQAKVGYDENTIIGNGFLFLIFVILKF